MQFVDFQESGPGPSHRQSQFGEFQYSVIPAGENKEKRTSQRVGKPWETATLVTFMLGITTAYLVNKLGPSVGKTR